MTTTPIIAIVNTVFNNSTRLYCTLLHIWFCRCSSIVMLAMLDYLSTRLGDIRARWTTGTERGNRTSGEHSFSAFFVNVHDVKLRMRMIANFNFVYMRCVNATIKIPLLIILSDLYLHARPKIQALYVSDIIPCDIS